jgi:hypothetical protein
VLLGGNAPGELQSPALAQVSMKTGRKFFIIIDEWGALFREAKDYRITQGLYPVTPRLI